MHGCPNQVTARLKIYINSDTLTLALLLFTLVMIIPLRKVVVVVLLVKKVIVKIVVVKETIYCYRFQYTFK